MEKIINYIAFDEDFSQYARGYFFQHFLCKDGHMTIFNSNSVQR